MAVETVEKSEKWRICWFFFQQRDCWICVEKLKVHYSFWKVERLWSWKEKLVENFVENSKEMERQKFFKKSHVETVETKNRIFVENGLGKIPDTQKNSQNFGRFCFSTNCGKRCWKSSESLWKTVKMAWNRLNFFAEIGTFFEKKRALQTQSGCILWNMQPFFQNRKSEICLHKMEKWGKKKRQSICL